MNPSKSKYSPGDCVFLVECKYLNDNHDPYKHALDETPSFLHVKIVRTVVKSVLTWKTMAGYIFYKCTFDKEYPEYKLFGTIYEAIESIPVVDPVLSSLKREIPTKLNEHPFNISKELAYRREFSMKMIHFVTP